MRTFILFALFISVVGSCKEECIVGASSYVWTTTIDGEPRRAIIWKPQNECIEAPILIYFHGRGGDAEDSEERRGFHDLLKEMYVVYAEGTNFDNRPDDAKGWETRFPHIKTECRKDKDIRYLLEILDELDADPKANTDRVGIAGHSSGGFFTLSLAQLMPDDFLGFACLGSYSSYIAFSSNIDCNNTYEDAMNLSLIEQANENIELNPAPTLFMFGTLESTIKPNSTVYDEDCNEWTYFQNSIIQIAKKNGAALDCNSDDFMNTFSRQIYGQGQGEVQLQLYDEDHSWPPEANAWAADYFADLLYY